MAVKYTTYEDFPYEDLLTYAGIDCIATSEIHDKLLPLLLENPGYTFVDGEIKTRKRIPSIASSMKKYTMPALEFICDMEINGIKYDVQKNQSTKVRMEAEVEELEDFIFGKTGKKLDLNSGKVMMEFLYREKGFEPLSFTKTGEPSVDGDAMAALADKYEADSDWLRAIGKRNDIASLYRTFVRDYVAEHVKRDGRIHPSYNLNGTSSFRITGDNPNLTQLPRAKHGYNVREFYMVGEGYVFIAFDFSSAEVKVLGALCRDPKLLEAIREGKDFHSFSASAMYNIPYEEFIATLEDSSSPNRKKYKEMRQHAKALTFGILYGSSPVGIALNMGVTKERAQELIDLYFKTYPEIEKFVNDSHEMALQNFLIVTPFGQRKHQFGTRSEFKYTAVYNASKRNAQNVRIQSPTSTLGLFCFTNLNTEIKKLGGKSLCTVYDSVELEVPIERAAEAIEAGFYYMNDYPQEVFDWLDFPIGVEGELGYNWGNTKEIHRGITQAEVMEILRGMSR